MVIARNQFSQRSVVRCAKKSAIVLSRVRRCTGPRIGHSLRGPDVRSTAIVVEFLLQRSLIYSPNSTSSFGTMRRCRHQLRRAGLETSASKLASQHVFSCNNKTGYSFYHGNTSIGFGYLAEGARGGRDTREGAREGSNAPADGLRSTRTRAGVGDSRTCSTVRSPVCAVPVGYSQGHSRRATLEN